MKINEVEARVGITKKNIRFYEEQGLIAPHRNSENGYREYGEAEVTTLQQIKLMRKLGVPLEEIRRMQSGGHTLGDGMRRHLVSLERDVRNLEQSMELCRVLKDREERLEHLDAAPLLEQMERMEQEGTTFLNKQQDDARAMSYVSSVASALGMTLLMVGTIVLMLWAYSLDLPDAPPPPLMAVLVAIPVLVVLGVFLALFQR
ncbi:MAG: MerR family transcriptional regulator, partial [Oscillibacter sp.]|nr:MerR family transcriptional regulator [Oscillibacter sp.]